MNDNWIVSANEWAGQRAPVLWRASWQGGLFIVAVWLLCKAIPRIPANTRHWLWWLASLQLLIRLLIASPVALPILPANPGHLEVMSAVSPLTSPAMPVQMAIRSEYRPQVQPASRTPEPPAKPVWPSLALLTLTAWGIGVVVCFIFNVRRVMRTRKLLRVASSVEGDPLIDLVVAMSAEIGVRPPRIQESERAPCPLLAGWLRPTIVLPAGSIHTLDETELGMAIAHELTHLKRRDLWFGLIPIATQVLFFFHPLAWLAANETAAAREEACDIEAMRLGGGTPASYARLLLNSAQSNSTAAVMGAAFGYRQIQRRIQMLKTSSRSYGVNARRAFSILIVLGAVCALPWTVTAQSASSAPTASKATHHKKILAAHKSKLSKTKKSTNAAHKVIGRGSITVASIGIASGSAKTSAMGGAHATAAISVRTPVGISGGTATASTSSGGAAMFGVAQSSGQGAFAARAGNSSALGGGFGQGSALGGGFGKGSALGGGFGTAKVAATGSAMGGKLTPSVASSSQDSGFGSTSTATTASSGGGKNSWDKWASSGTVAIGDPGKYFVKFERCDLAEAIKKLCTAANKDYVLKSNVEHDTVTLSLNNQSFETALQSILRAVNQQLTYRAEDGIYQIQPKGD